MRFRIVVCSFWQLVSVGSSARRASLSTALQGRNVASKWVSLDLNVGDEADLRPR